MGDSNPHGRCARYADPIEHCRSTARIGAVYDIVIAAMAAAFAMALLWGVL